MMSKSNNALHNIIIIYKSNNSNNSNNGYII